MCGRFSIHTPPERLAERFTALLPDTRWPPRYNAAPTQALPVILNEGQPRIALLRWGLIPSWAKDPAVGARMINARAETVADRPSFRDPFRRRRCLVLADGFYEWRKSDRGKTPMRIALRSEEPFAFAGLWDVWDDPQGAQVRTFTIITTTANTRLSAIHQRMPAILRPEDESLWLDDGTDRPALLGALQPYPDDLLVAYPVSPRVNSPRHDDPSVIAPT